MNKRVNELTMFNYPSQWLPLLLLFVSCFINNAYTQTNRCEFNFSGCMSDFNGDTIVVSDDIVALSARVKSCIPAIQKPAEIKPPAIVFVIDNSGSMQSGSTANDPMGSRFVVVRDLIDSVYKVYPKAEISLVVFNNRLFFDTTTTTSHNEQTYYFKRFFIPLEIAPNYKSQAFLKLIRLDSTYATNSGNKRGIEIVKDVLLTQTRATTGQNPATYIDLIYAPPTLGTGTDITLAFNGAKQAISSTTTPKGRQFIIFLSDGEPTGASISNQWDFVKGILVPTTFTVYFTQSAMAPDSLIKMTNNIKTNSYSKTNTLNSTSILSTRTASFSYS